MTLRIRAEAMQQAMREQIDVMEVSISVSFSQFFNIFMQMFSLYLMTLFLLVLFRWHTDYTIHTSQINLIRSSM